MPGLLFTTRYQKLDDTIHLLCRNCGHTVDSNNRENSIMSTQVPPRSSSRFLSGTSKHFLTWSATAANHKIQKLSKHFVQNVSKLHTKVERVLQPHHHQQHQPWDPSCVNNNNNNQSEFTPSSSATGQSAESHEHLLSVNNVNMALVHNLPVTRGSNNVNDSSNNDKFEPFDERNNNGLLDWRTSARLRRRFDFELERSKFIKSFGEGLDIFELKSLGSTEMDHRAAIITEMGQIRNSPSSSSNDTTSSGISTGASTIPALTPHWSRSSSMTNSMASGGSVTQSETVLLPDDEREIEAISHHHMLPSLVTFSPIFRKSLMKKIHFGSEILSSPITSQVSLKSGTNQKPLSNSQGLLSPREKVMSACADASQLMMSKGQSELSISILQEEPELRQAPWFHAGIPREIALEVLRNEPLGSFIVRESTTRSGCFALSLRVPHEFQPIGIAHYLILKTGRGYKIKGFTKEFGSLTSLITHHTVMPELLPVALFRPSCHPTRVSRDNSADFVEPEKLITIRKYTDF